MVLFVKVTLKRLIDFLKILDNEDNFKIDPGWSCKLKTSFQSDEDASYLVGKHFIL